MYTDEDLDSAVEKGIFTEESVVQFRSQLATSKDISAVDEENFRLITSFNDVFVVIASGLLLISSAFVLTLFSLPIVAWGLAEFFVRKRKMALPAIVLLLCFVGGVFASSMSLFDESSIMAYLVSSSLSAIAAYLHFLRFQVPITVAAGTAAVSAVVVTLILSVIPAAKEWALSIVFVCGVISFFFAMYWDASDLKRETRRSDVAFWLHLLSAPLIVHPIFIYLGILDGSESVVSMASVVFLYFIMTTISIVVDRRAFMVSSLVYVLYAISKLLEAYGVVGYGFAITGVCIGAALLLLSAFWHPVRKFILFYLPTSIQNYVPKLN
jgi:hypothetical protein